VHPWNKCLLENNTIYVSFRHGVDAPDGNELFKLPIFTLVRDAPGVFMKLRKPAVDAATARKLEFERIDFFSDGYALPTEEILIGTDFTQRSRDGTCSFARSCTPSSSYARSIHDGGQPTFPRSGDVPARKTSKAMFWATN